MVKSPQTGKSTQLFSSDRATNNSARADDNNDENVATNNK